MIKAILLDIEGTTSPIEFVYSVLFPYAKSRLSAFCGSNKGEPWFGELMERLSLEHAQEGNDSPEWSSAQDIRGAIAYLEWLMDRDRKSTALKTIQGEIWKDGFTSGELKGEMFPDVRPSLERWTREGKRVIIFSSGSVLAQQQLFKFSTQGDLSGFLSGYFDTETGPKRSAESYRLIAHQIGCTPGEILFLSDVPEELEAARLAGLNVTLILRPGNKASESHNFPEALNFDLERI